MANDTYRGLTDPALSQLKGNDRYWYFRRRILERDGGVCGICQESLTIAVMDIDHVIPRSVGGADHWDNLRATHSKCNRSRWLGEYADGRTRGDGVRLGSNAAAPMPLKIPTGMHIKIRDLAKREQRTIGNQIIWLLRRAIETGL